MKIAQFTDIHFGCKNNSKLHNQDCIDFLNWFIEQVKIEKCDAIAFLGDWFENRNAINVSTLNASFDALKSLNNLGLPIYFCVGNHDLYHRNNRDQFSTYHFTQFENVTLVNEETVVDDMIFFPFLFKNEYPLAAASINKHQSKYVFGHFEFKNFIVTGSDRKIEHGPDHTQFTGPTYIFSGHFHKRQALDNVVYIGNTFPTNYGDAWDDSRGMAILDTSNDDVTFYNWEDCPKYRKIKLSDVINDNNLDFPKKCRVKCIIDIDISYSDAQSLRDELVKTLQLREFSLEENLKDKKDAIAGQELMEDFDISSINDAVIKMLKDGISESSNINSRKLIDIYSTL